MHIFWLFLLPWAFGIKIGVSKMSTTTTTTSAPNLKEVTTIEPDSIENLTKAADTTTIATTSIRPTTAELEFPPKITKKPKKNPTSKPTVSTTTTTEPTTTVNVPTSKASNVENASFPSFTTNEATHFYCSCNLMPSSCDINCCCDPDCAKEALKVFNCFLPSKYPELRVRLEDFQYEHGLPSCKINDGWLCVFRTNTRPPATKVFSYNFDVAKHFKWPSSLTKVAEIEQRTVRDFYKFGEPIYLIDENTLEKRNFELPYAFKPPYCKLKEPIRHLMPVERHCLVTLHTTAQSAERELQSLIETNKLLSRPISDATNAENLEDHMLRFQAKTITKNLKNKMDNHIEINNFSNETEAEDLQQSFIKEINIKITHNFTDLLHCLIEITLQEIADNETQEITELWQKYSVQFIAANATEEEQSTGVKSTTSQFGYSGPLGYLLGEPLIAAKFVANNETEEMSAQNRILDYFKMPIAKQNTLRVLARENGFCQQGYDTIASLNFGISSLHQCSLRIPHNSFGKSIKNMNATEICLTLQQQILMQLFEKKSFEDLTELYVSILGYPQNVTEKWLPLQVQNVDFAPAVGQLIADSQLIICRNVLLSAAYEFHVGTFTEQGIAHQSLVKHAVLKLGQRNDLEFSLDEQLEVPLTLTVMFYDLSSNTGFVSVYIKSSCFSFMLVIFCLRLI